MDNSRHSLLPQALLQSCILTCTLLNHPTCITLTNVCGFLFFQTTKYVFLYIECPGGPKQHWTPVTFLVWTKTHTHTHTHRGAATDSGPPGQHFHSGPPGGGGGGVWGGQRILNAGAEGLLDQ